jgi:hypothetical protein
MRVTRRRRAIIFCRVCMHSFLIGSVSEFGASFCINNGLFQIFILRCVEPLNDAEGELKDPNVE